MALLNDAMTGPPGGWRYVQPESGCEILSNSSIELAEQMVQHRKYKQLPGADFQTCILDLQRQLCSALEPRFCRAEAGEDYRPIVDMPMSMTMEKAKAGSLAFLEFIRNKGEVVDKKESERRAAICRGCRYNRSPDGCGTCSVLYAMISSLIPSSRSEPGLKGCGVCGCMLKAKVLMPAAVLEASEADRNLTYPPHCWQNSL